MTKRACLWLLLLVALAPAANERESQQKHEMRERVERNMGQDRFAAGCPLSVADAVRGDVILAGCMIETNAEVGGDALLTGGNVRIGGAVKQSVYAAGGRVALNAVVGRNLRAGGGNIEVGPQAKVAGNASLGGGEVQVLGPVDGYLQAAGGRVLIDAAIGGDVEVAAGELELGPNARIAGRLRYTSRNELKRDAQAQVQGGVERAALPESQREAMRAPKAVAGIVAWVWLLGLMLLAAVLVGLLPARMPAIADTVRTRWAWSLLIGFIALVCIPVAAVILLATVIGAPLALLLGALYAALLLLGYVIACVALGTIALQRFKPEQQTRTGWRIAAAVAGVLLVGVLTRIPFVGALIAFAALLLGMGAVLLQWRVLRQEGVVA